MDVSVKVVNFRNKNSGELLASVAVTGKTFPVKDTLKSLGFYWSRKYKNWAKVVPAGQADTLRDNTLAELGALTKWGPAISTVTGEVIDNRTFKEKYGHCEDAPCCGCCGTHEDIYGGGY